MKKIRRHNHMTATFYGQPNPLKESSKLTIRHLYEGGARVLLFLAAPIFIDWSDFTFFIHNML